MAAEFLVLILVMRTLVRHARIQKDKEQSPTALLRSIVETSNKLFVTLVGHHAGKHALSTNDLIVGVKMQEGEMALRSAFDLLGRTIKFDSEPRKVSKVRCCSLLPKLKIFFVFDS
jgi:hypothetical protein